MEVTGMRTKYLGLIQTEQFCVYLLFRSLPMATN